MKGDREGRTVSPTQFAVYLGIKQQYVNKWIHGKEPPEKREIVQILFKFYGADVFYALGFIPENQIIDPEDADEAARKWLEEQDQSP